MAYQTILSSQKSTYGSPYCNYTVEVEPSTRTASTLAVNIRVTAWLNASDSYLGTGNTLTGNLTLGSTTISFIIHASTDSWSGTTKHTITSSGTVSGISNSTTSLSAKFSSIYSGYASDNPSQLNATTCSSLNISSYTPPTPTVHTITTTNISSYVAGYPGDNFSLQTAPSGGSDYTYKWFRGDTQVSTSQTYTGTISGTMDNTVVYCVVSDSTGGEATTNKCEFRVGLTSSRIAINTHQVQPIKIYNGTKFIDSIPFIKILNGLMYCNWTITRGNTNIVGLAVVDKAIAG